MKQTVGRGLAIAALSGWIGLAIADDAYDPATADSELMPKADKAIVTDIARSGNGAVAVGERGHVFLIDDTGTWKQVQVPTRAMLTNVYALDSYVWAVGHDEVILHSSDAGNHWVRQHVNTDAFGPLLDVLFLDPQRGFAIGTEGTLLSSTDGGQNWETGLITDRVKPSTGAPAAAAGEAAEEDEESLVASDEMGEDETPPHLNAIVRSAKGLLIVGESGAGYRSEDEGASWERFELPYTGSMFGAVVLDDDSVIAFGLRGKAFRSTDLGRNWEALDSGSDAGLMGGAAVPGGRAVLVGGSGTVLTFQAGSPALKPFQYADGGLLGGVLHLSDNQFLLGGENGLARFKAE